MIALDPLTVLLFSALLVIVTSALFLSDTWGPQPSVPERLWCGAFAGSLLACVLLAPVELLPGARSSLVVLSNCLLVLAPSLVWSGMRAFNGRPPLLPVTGGLIAVTALAGVMEPHDFPWEGMTGYLAAMITALCLLVWETLRTRGPYLRTVVAFAVYMVLLAAYYTMRLIVFHTLGPDSGVFTTYASTQVTGILSALGVLVTALTLIVLRHERQHVARAELKNFDPMTGARTASSFAARSAELIRTLKADGAPAALVVFAPERDREIAVAFSQEHADRALVAIGEKVISLLPMGAIVSRDGDLDRAFLALLPATSESAAAQWAEEVRAAIITEVFDAATALLRLPVAIGVASTQEQGYDLSALRSAAHQAARASDGPAVAA